MRFGLSPATAIRWQALVRTKGDVKPKPQGGDQRSHIVDIHSDTILGLVAEKDDMTLDEISEALAQRSIYISRVAIWRFFKRRKMTSKKSAHACEQNRPDILRRRHLWFESQLDLDPEKLVFLDEAGVNTKMARLHGRAPKGQRLRSPIPTGTGKPRHILAACA